MSKQFGREIKIEITSKSQLINVSNLRVRFDIKKNIAGVPDIAKIEIYNLSRDKRERIKEEFEKITVTAGYENNTAVIFSGEIRNVFHQRSRVDFITQIFAGDGDQAYKRSFSNFTIAENSTVESIIDLVIKDMSGISKGEIDIKKGSNKLKGRTFSGPSRDILKQLAKDYDFNFSIENNKLNCVDANSVLKTETVLISSNSGMIDTPIITARGINVTTLLNTKIRINSLFQVEAQTDVVKFGNLFLKEVPQTLGSGTYKTAAINYLGDTHGTEWYTLIEGLNRL